MLVPNSTSLNVEPLKIYKDNIKNNFNRAAYTYEKVSFVQKEITNDLVDFYNLHLPHFKPSRILDIGAGTGAVSKQLFDQHDQAEFILCDLSHAMLKIAREKFCDSPAVHFIVSDAEEYNFPINSLTISSLAFQWFIDLQKTLNKLFKNTEILAFTTLYNGTFAEWKKIHSELDINCAAQDYPSVSHLENYCLNLKPSQTFFMAKQYKLSFENVLSFMKYLKDLGANTPKVNSTSQVSCLKRLIDYKAAPITVSYNIFFALVIK